MAAHDDGAADGAPDDERASVDGASDDEMASDREASACDEAADDASNGSHISLGRPRRFGDDEFSEVFSPPGSPPRDAEHAASRKDPSEVVEIEDDEACIAHENGVRMNKTLRKLNRLEELKLMMAQAREALSILVRARKVFFGGVVSAWHAPHSGPH